MKYDKNPFGIIRTHSDMYGPIRTHLEQLGPIPPKLLGPFLDNNIISLKQAAYFKDDSTIQSVL